MSLDGKELKSAEAMLVVIKCDEIVIMTEF
jgi:hypothetical protein